MLGGLRRDWETLYLVRVFLKIILWDGERNWETAHFWLEYIALSGADAFIYATRVWERALKSFEFQWITLSLFASQFEVTIRRATHSLWHLSKTKFFPSLN